MTYNRYKDREPSETISMAKTLLSNLGLNVVETAMFNPLTGIYSSRIDIPSLNFGTNGKGTTKEYCQASAYGELLEKLLNVYFPTNFFYVSPFKHFVSFCDETEFCISKDLSFLPSEILDDMRESFFDADGRYPEYEDLVDVYQTLFGGDEIGCIPFYDVSSRANIRLPYRILASLSHSTGFSCGNSLEEAITQALCEVFERYAYRTIISEGIILPKIPLIVIQSVCEEFMNMIDSFNQCGYDVTFYDCSVGIGLPVVGMSLIDKETQSYKITFGAHSSFKIAIERCLTEALQGFGDVSELKYSMTTFDDKTTNSCQDAYTYYSRFRKNKGAVPYSFFLGEINENYSPWDTPINNEDGVQRLLSLCLNNGHKVYIRNNYCDGFYAIRVYVSGMSHNRFIEPKGNTTKYSVMQRLILEGYTNLRVDDISSYKELLQGNFGRIEKFSRLPNSLLLAAYFYDCGDVLKAIDVLEQSDSRTDIENILLQLFLLVLKDYNDADINKLLTTFYPNNVVYFVYSLLQGSLFENLLLSRNNKGVDYSKIERNIQEYVLRYIERLRVQPSGQNMLLTYFENVV